jgi:hypothetical protein
MRHSGFPNCRVVYKSRNWGLNNKATIFGWYKPPVGPFRAKINGWGVPALTLRRVQQSDNHTSRQFSGCISARTLHPTFATHSKLYLMLPFAPQTWRPAWLSSVQRGFDATDTRATNCTSRGGLPRVTRAGMTLLNLTTSASLRGKGGTERQARKPRTAATCFPVQFHRVCPHVRPR